MFHSYQLPGPILVVEDNESDALTIKLGFGHVGVANAIHFVQNGCAAVAYLQGDPPYDDRSKHPAPAVVLLDIKMPGMDGFDVLRWIRQQSRFELLPVIMVTGSNEVRLVTKAYELGATSFLVKPLDFSNASQLMHLLQRAPIHARMRRP